MTPRTRSTTVGGDACTLGIVARNGSIGARPANFGMVSDADGAIGSLAAAPKGR
ncbi:DUF1177 family protein [Burkholderia diffusa]|uniref:DUF1177 family protein n=1 Tax=Burkholderia diffusa TaxID=488732 RepID=UPI000A7FE09C|nr:DUF1177 family protein [Burkholderia diffusa]